MKKSEIEQAIRNGESVWVANKYCIPYEVNLTNNHYIDIVDNKESLMLAHIDDVELIDYLEYVFETKEKAQHYYLHANISRVERLPFLTWEEFDKGDRLIRFTGKNGEKCKLEGYQNDDKQSGFIDVVVNGTGSNIDYDYTEQNFYKAYDECVKLFKQE